MIRYIPGKTRIKTEFLKNITLGDILLGIACLAFAIVIMASNLFKIAGGDYRWYALLGWLAFSIALYLPVDDGLRLWSSVTLIIKFSAYPKKFSKKEKQNMSGSIKAKECKVSTTSGDASARYIECDYAVLNTFSGDINLTGKIKEKKARSFSGEINYCEIK